jgi:protein-S-isoprenylcysteine O-methyltransferase Ste14
MRSNEPGATRLAIAALCYVAAIAPMVYFVGFLGDFAVPRTIDGPLPASRAGSSTIVSGAALDAALILAFALVHSVLARPSWKRRVAARLGRDLERPAYSAVAGVQLALLMAAWRPLPGALWTVEAPAVRFALWALFGLGWAIAAAGAVTLGTARLYGLAPMWDRFRGRLPRPDRLELVGPYRWIRHPLYSGTILALWAAPRMSVGRALLATLFTLYILVGSRLEERDLLAAHGERFADYRRRVGAFFPRLGAERRRRSGKG